MAIALLLLFPAVFVSGDSIWSKQHVDPPNFAIGASCAIETDKLAQDPDSIKLKFSTEDAFNDACARCWLEALRTRKERVIEEHQTFVQCRDPWAENKNTEQRTSWIWTSWST